jgi:hypothetical protein
MLLAHEQHLDELVESYLRRTWNAGLPERILVLRALATTQPPTSKALESMLQGLDDPDIGVARTAVDGLAKWGSATTPYLLQEARDESSRLRAYAFHALVTDRPPSPEIVQMLTAAIAEENDSLAKSAASALGSMKEAAAPATGALVTRLRACQTIDPSEMYQLHMSLVNTLKAIGPAAREADGELRRLMERTDIKDHTDIAWALASIHGDASVALPIIASVIEAATRDVDHGNMRHALYVIRELQLKDESVAPAIVSYLEKAHALYREDEKGYTTRRMAVWSTVDVLGKMGPAAKVAIPTLEKIAADPGFKDDLLRKKLQGAMEAIGRD